MKEIFFLVVVCELNCVMACDNLNINVCGGEYKLTANQITEYESSAVDGDPAKAYALWNHYVFAASDAKTASKWLVIAAENGSPDAQARYASELLNVSQSERACRAFYWAKKAKQNGAKGDIDTLLEEASAACKQLKKPNGSN